MSTAKHPQHPWQRCPYLGLHDDRSTSLAYASPWNYCYRAEPPGSVAASYQSRVCLRRCYVDCAVYHSTGSSRLPRYLRVRGKSTKLQHPVRIQVVRLVELSLLITILILLLLYAGRLLP
jgi:hypothetical protein